MAFKHLILAAAALALLAPGAALAMGKVGTWSVTSTGATNGMPAASTTTTYCMTKEQVVSNKPMSDSSGCVMTNAHTSGHTMIADMVCKGSFNATGHFEQTFDTDSHYTTRISMHMSEANMDVKTTVDAHWVKADCAGAMH